jgi:hypothetical protein
MRNAGAKLWRARLAITAVILIVPTSAVIIGHHQAWAGNSFYQASLRDDLYFVLAVVIAFGVAAIGAFSRPYFLTLNLVYFYLAILNVKTLFTGEFILVGDHGCVACIDGALIFVNDMPTYVIAGLLAATTTALFADRTPRTLAPRTRIYLAIAVVLIVALVASQIEFLYISQIAYVEARLLRLVPYVAAALVGTILATLFKLPSTLAGLPPRLLRTRLTLAGLLVAGVLLANLLDISRG